jgi:hypothetical protein
LSVVPGISLALAIRANQTNVAIGALAGGSGSEVSAILSKRLAG